MTMQHTMLYTGQFSFSKDTERRVRHMAMYNVICRADLSKYFMHLTYKSFKVICSIINRKNFRSHCFKLFIITLIMQ